MQREIEALELEKRQRLGQDAAATDQMEASGPVGRVRTVVVNRGQALRL